VRRSHNPHPPPPHLITTTLFQQIRVQTFNDVVYVVLVIIIHSKSHREGEKTFYLSLASYISLVLLGRGVLEGVDRLKKGWPSTPTLASWGENTITTKCTKEALVYVPSSLWQIPTQVTRLLYSQETLVAGRGGAGGGYGRKREQCIFGIYGISHGVSPTGILSPFY
jgi:hypothetical protein